LADFLRNTTINVQELTLCHNDIDDECVDALLGGLLTNASLSILNLRHNRIVSGGCQSLAALLVNPNSNLEELHLGFNNIGDEGACIFANALSTNRKLKTLSLGNNNEISAEGWPCFSKVLCDTSSINNAFHSNHMLESLGDDEDMPADNMPVDVKSLLALNRRFDDKKQVAIKKILKHHQHFDMQPFFEWDLKVLPIAVKWFERAQSIENNEEVGVGRHKLGAIYQFIRAMPEVFEPAPWQREEKEEAVCS
jgi:Ran GTPase-activating protein (RanGAP) involved in mRNA processing and transport